MRPSKRPITIATRASKLALAQANAVARALRTLHPRVEVELLPMEAEADRIADHPLAAFGGKGLFTRSIELALLHEKADIAVHSLKDLPVEQTPGLVVAAIPKRCKVNDVLISPHGKTIDALPQGATVGTCSPRRAAQLLKLRPDLQIHPLRGTIQTRIERIMKEKKFDATLLALAGLHRAGLMEYVADLLSIDTMLPAAGQAALAVQCRAADHVTLRRCLPLNDAISAATCQAERKVVEMLGADCHSPIAAYAEHQDDGSLKLRAAVYSIDGSKVASSESTSAVGEAQELAEIVTHALKSQGAEALLEAARVQG